MPVLENLLSQISELGIGTTHSTEVLSNIFEHPKGEEAARIVGTLAEMVKYNVPKLFFEKSQEGYLSHLTDEFYRMAAHGTAANIKALVESDAISMLLPVFGCHSNLLSCLVSDRFTPEQIVETVSAVKKYINDDEFKKNANWLIPELFMVDSPENIVLAVDNFVSLQKSAIEAALNHKQDVSRWNAIALANLGQRIVFEQVNAPVAAASEPAKSAGLAIAG